MAGVAFAVEGDGVGFATESYAASALYTTLASLSGALWRIRRANIEKVLSIVVGCLLSALGISLFVAALRGRFPVTAMNSIKGKLLTHAFCAAPSAFVCGFSLVRTIKHFDILYLTVTVLFGLSLIFDLFWTRREVRRLAASETAKKHATQFLWSCIFFNTLSLGLGYGGVGLRLV